MIVPSYRGLWIYHHHISNCLHTSFTFIILSQSIREQVTQKHANRRLHLERHLSELKSTISEHTSGRKLLSDEDYNRHLKFVQGLHRKLAALEEKDPRIAQLEIEEEIELQEKMLQGEFLWDMERGELVLKDDLQV